MQRLLAVSVFFAEIAGLSGIGLTAAWMAGYLGGFAWDGGPHQFNVHPLMMVVGLLFFNGNGE